MAKKSSKVVSIIKDQAAAAQGVPEPLKLDEVTLLKMKAFASTARASRSELQLTQHSMNEYIRKVDPEGKIIAMNNRIQALAQETAKVEQQYRTLVEEIGKKFGIDMTKYAYDEDTGVLHEIPLPGTPAAEATDKK